MVVVKDVHVLTCECCFCVYDADDKYRKLCYGCEAYFEQFQAEIRVKTEILDELGLGSVFEKRINDFQQLKAELDEHRWKPVSEGLPKESGYYQCLREINRYPTTREYCAASLMWMSREEITHWKPIILSERDNG